MTRQLKTGAGLIAIWVLSICGTATADVAWTLAEYLYCENESELTSGRECIKCIKPDESSDVDWPLCKEDATFAEDGYEKVCQSNEMYGYWAEIWCEAIDDGGVGDTETESENTDTASTGADDDDTGKKDDGCSVSRVGDTSGNTLVSALLSLILG